MCVSCLQNFTFLNINSTTWRTLILYFEILNFWHHDTHCLIQWLFEDRLDYTCIERLYACWDPKHQKSKPNAESEVWYLGAATSPLPPTIEGLAERCKFLSRSGTKALPLKGFWAFQALTVVFTSTKTLHRIFKMVTWKTVRLRTNFFKARLHTLCGLNT